MIDLKTTYMGLELRNPLVVASSGLTATVDGIQRIEDAGAGAVVLKSIFEEQIAVDVDDLTQNTWLPGHPEAFDYVREMGFALGPAKYIDLIAEAKKRVVIPVIASLNCISASWWTDYAKKIEDAGADALELNISVMPSDPKRTSAEIEKIYFDILESVKLKIKLALALKVGPYFTSMSRFADELARRGASSLVLFNRFYQFDIDYEKLTLSSGNPLSMPCESSNCLRWVALLSGRLGIDLAASTGVHESGDVIKHLLAGATVIQLASTLYKNGVGKITSVLSELEEWMVAHGFKSLADFRGRLSQAHSEKPELYERLQYIKALVGVE
jgi:dihydroorotate dehydrogenase (fumarate)